MKPDVARQIGLRSRTAQTLEMRVFERPGRIVLHEGPALFRRATARQEPRALGELRRPPFAQRLNMRRTALGEDVAGEMVAPHQERHFQFDPRQGFLAMDDDMIRSPVLEAVTPHELERVFDIPEPEATGVEEMRAEIGQHARALIAPGRVAHQPRRAIAVEYAAGIDRTELAAGDKVAHADEMRLETVIVSGIANEAIAARQRLKCRDFAFVLRPQ